jgi:hypothetical protein
MAGMREIMVNTLAAAWRASFIVAAGCSNLKNDPIRQ